MSDFIPKPPAPKLTGLGPRAQKLAALREKARAQAANQAGKPISGESTPSLKTKNSFAGKKTAFQRKAT
jgi:hypothetical protein